MTDDRTYLRHILQCIARIDEYVVGGESSFIESTLIKDAVMRNLQTLGESTRRISQVLKSDSPDIDWRGISRFRNVIVHDYLDISLDRIWEVIVRDLPVLKNQVEALLSDQRGAP